MLKVARRLLLIFAIAGFGCGEASHAPFRANKPPLTQPAAPPVVQEEKAAPTISESPDENYEVPVSPVVVDGQGTKTELIIGKAKVSQTRLSFSVTDGKLRLSGRAIIKNEKQQIIAEKEFSITGQKAPAENSALLSVDEISAGDGSIVVRGKSTCIGVSAQNKVDCSHIVTDVLIKFDNKMHTEQLESIFPVATPTEPDTSLPPAIVPAPVPAPAPTVAPSPPVVAAPVAGEPQANPEDLQGEDEDNSVDGRFEGTTSNVNIDELFTASAGTEAKPKPPAPAPTPAPEIEQTTDGEVRPVNQALGYPNSGRLRNATSLLLRQQTLKAEANFEVCAPARSRHFGTYELSEIIIRAGKELSKNHNRKLYLSSISDHDGGRLAPHKSHQMGVDADIAYPAISEDVKFPLVVRMNPPQFYTQNYSTRSTYELFRFLFKQTDIRVDRIFVDRHIIKELCSYAKSRNEFEGEQKEEVRQMFQNLQHVKGHGDHFHLRIKCSKSDPGCRSRIYRKMSACG